MHITNIAHVICNSCILLYYPQEQFFPYRPSKHEILKPLEVFKCCFCASPTTSMVRIADDSLLKKIGVLTPDCHTYYARYSTQAFTPCHAPTMRYALEPNYLHLPKVFSLPFPESKVDLPYESVKLARDIAESMNQDPSDNYHEIIAQLKCIAEITAAVTESCHNSIKELKKQVTEDDKLKSAISNTSAARAAVTVDSFYKDDESNEF